MTALTFDAAHLAPAWLSVFQASGAEASQPAFYRSMVIEFFPTGIRLVASDQTVLLYAWVPSLDDIDVDPPGLDEAPKATAIAMDSANRAKGLLEFAWKLVGRDEDAIPVEITLSVEEADEEVPQGRLDLEVPGGELVVLDVPGKERVRLQMYQGSWPDWRPIAAGFKPKSTSAIALGPAMIGRLAKLGKWHMGALTWTWGGAEGVAKIRIGDHPVVINGFIMPMLWHDDEEVAPAAQPPDFDGEP